MIITNEYGTWIIKGNIEVLIEGTETQKFIDEMPKEIKNVEPTIEDKIKQLEEAIVELTLKQLESGGTNGII